MKFFALVATIVFSLLGINLTAWADLDPRFTFPSNFAEYSKSNPASPSVLVGKWKLVGRANDPSCDPQYCFADQGYWPDGKQKNPILHDPGIYITNMTFAIGSNDQDGRPTMTETIEDIEVHTGRKYGPWQEPSLWWPSQQEYSFVNKADWLHWNSNTCRFAMTKKMLLCYWQADDLYTQAIWGYVRGSL